MMLLIDNYDSFTYNVYQLLAQYDTNIHVVRNDHISIDEIRDLNPSAMILSPGPGHPRDAGVCIDTIRIFSGIIPILGICLGHQAIVHAFGGDVVGAGELVHGKASDIVHDHEGLFRDLPSPFQAGRYHSLIAAQDSLPDCLHIHAHCEPDLIMGIKHESHPTYGLQFHPESILTPQGYQLIARFLDLAGCVVC